MSLRLNYFRKVFHFNFKARTSRGLMKDKTSWFIRMHDDNDPHIFGLGECGPLPGLSIDDRSDFEEKLGRLIDLINRSELSLGQDDHLTDIVPREFPSIRFGVETALLDLRGGGKRLLFNNGFADGNPIPINGLVWMGDMDFMMDQITRKVAEGFRCLKLKVGGLDFERECDILSYIRRRYFREDIQIRLDANGAFKLDDVLYKLGELARFGVHSIEQPIKPGQEAMEELCRKSPIPIALDEELINVLAGEDKTSLLAKLKPQFIVLKPTLHGGLRGCEEWIKIADAQQVGWWITSALESSIGLNAVCQFTANYKPVIPQGLGTGAIYSNNFSSPLIVRYGKIFWDHEGKWDADLISEISAAGGN
jgi:O-succinylbenzoate synthase